MASLQGWKLRLKNRQGVKGELSQFENDMVVTEQLISPHHGHHCRVWITRKIEFLKEQSFREARAAQDVKDVLEKLKIEAVAENREYLLPKINQFKHYPQF